MPFGGGTMKKQEWREVSLRFVAARPRGITTFLFGADLLLLSASWYLAAGGGLVRRLSASVLLLLALLQLYLVLHEAIHRSASPHRRLNELIGHLCGWIIFLPFLPRQRNHLLHHVWAAHPTRDPENSKMIERFSVMTRGEATKVELLWRSWLPVMGLNHFLATWWSPFEERRRGRRSRRYAKEARWAIVYVAAYAILAALVIVRGKTSLFVSWFFPPWFMLLVLAEMLNLPHHAEAPLLAKEAEALPYWAQDAVSHNCGSLPIWSKFVILNFNLHIAHHLFPSVPWYELPRVERLIQEKTGQVPAAFKNEFAWSLVNRRRPLLQLMGHFFDKRTGAYENRRATIHGR